MKVVQESRKKKKKILLSFYFDYNDLIDTTEEGSFQLDAI